MSLLGSLATGSWWWNLITFVFREACIGGLKLLTGALEFYVRKNVGESALPAPEPKPVLAPLSAPTNYYGGFNTPKQETFPGFVR